MPTELGNRYSVDWRGKPPHMLVPDHAVWYRFLDRYGQYFKALYYDCLLGGIFLTPDQEKDVFQRMWRYNNSKRADAIAELEDEIWIIEVASTPRQQALGQLLNYRVLWFEDPPISKPVKLALICERFDTDLAASWGKYGIQLYVV